jgi:hypothetical protein
MLLLLMITLKAFGFIDGFVFELIANAFGNLITQLTGIV